VFKRTLEYLTMADVPFKQLAYEQVARVGKAISSPIRLEILDLLAQAPSTVERLAAAIGHSVANTSQHLQVLRQCRLVTTEKAGTFVTYRLAGDAVGPFLLQVRTLAHARLTELAQLRQDVLARRGALEGVDSKALVARVRRGDVTVIDVRPSQEYTAGHIAGAISIPLADLRRRLRQLPKDREIVAYCRGPYCVMALDAVTLLRTHGRTAHHLEYGVAEWQALGGRIVAGDAPASSAGTAGPPGT
jgi:rhodanese-related sulfurtransferase